MNAPKNKKGVRRARRAIIQNANGQGGDDVRVAGGSGAVGVGVKSLM